MSKNRLAWALALALPVASAFQSTPRSFISAGMALFWANPAFGHVVPLEPAALLEIIESRPAGRQH